VIVECVHDEPDPRDAPVPPLAVWEFAGLLLTYGCNARCAFCYVCAGPERDASMSVDSALALWRSLDELAAGQGKTMRIHLSGGEPFRDWMRLVSIVRAARDAGLTPLEKVETNAFWATEDGLTRARLELLDALGMGKLVVSTDVFHQEYVPLECVQRCVQIGRQVLGRDRVSVRRWGFLQHPVDTGQLSPAQKEDAFRQALLRYKDRLTGRAAMRLARLLPGQPAEAFRGQSCVQEMLQGRHVHIDPYGHIFPGTCAGIILGQAGSGSHVADIWRALAVNWSQHPVVEAVVAGGSYELLQRAIPLGYQELPGGYASKCHLCTHVRHFLCTHGLWPEFVGPPACYAD
jgi:hypothetical protein